MMNGVLFIAIDEASERGNALHILIRDTIQHNTLQLEVLNTLPKSYIDEQKIMTARTFVMSMTRMLHLHGEYSNPKKRKKFNNGSR